MTPISLSHRALLLLLRLCDAIEEQMDMPSAEVSGTELLGVCCLLVIGGLLSYALVIGLAETAITFAWAIGLL